MFLPTFSHLQRLRDISREKSAEMTRMYSQMSQLGQLNAELVLKNIDANTKMADLGARQQALEEELARVTVSGTSRRRQRSRRLGKPRHKLPSCNASGRRSRRKLGKPRRRAPSYSASEHRSSSKRPSSSTRRWP